MDLRFKKDYTYKLIEETKIETECGALYQAQDLEFNRTVAVKMIEIQGKDEYQKKAAYDKAYSEVSAMISLSEEKLAIPTIYTTYYDKAESKLFIVMDWIKGSTLTEHMNDPELRIIQWMIDLCSILETMEKKHIFHKDIKPSNIMIDNKGKLYLIDFNISISTPNLLEGTINYKAPEMAEKSKYVGREKVDMFSIGVILYEFYAGHVPVKGKEYSKNRSRGKYQWDKYVSPIEFNENINEKIEVVIEKCMKLNPKERYRNYSELKRDLIKAMRDIKCTTKKK